MQNLTLSITQLNNYIKNIFDNEEMLIGISVYGEVTNFKISSSIAYFDIKEEGAQLSCVKFSSPVPFAKNGDMVIVTGKLNYHVRLGKLSFVVSKVEKYGMGELYQKYLLLKDKLQKEGVFDESKKIPVPKYAHTIGVVTSETGAVIRDIYHVTKQKNPYTNILIYPVKVQGEGAEKEIKEGIEYFNKAKNVDVIIVARGGGSFEDLSPFNTEVVARAVFDSELPIISGVGHETDFTICDFASDLRAPTPSVAADQAVFDFYNELQYLTTLKDTIIAKVIEKTQKCKENVVNIASLMQKSMENLLSISSMNLKHLIENLSLSMTKLVKNKQSDLNLLVAKIEKTNPLEILKSGYARITKDGKGVDIDQIKVGDVITSYLSGGQIESRVEKLIRSKK